MHPSTRLLCAAVALVSPAAALHAGPDAAQAAAPRGAAAAVASAPAAPKPRTAADVLAETPASAWRAIAPDDLLVIDLADGRRVVVALAAAFAPGHVANIRTLARAGWYDDATIYRVQDNWVTQWGDWTEKKPLPRLPKVAAEYERPIGGAGLVRFPQRDVYAAQVGHVGPFPAAADPEGGKAWLTHCYGSVGVARDLNPDVGTGAELYAVLGPARQLDRNITVVGRVVAGMDILSAFPRGTGAMGVYDKAEQRVPIRRVRIAADMPEGERPSFEVLDAASPSFAEILRIRTSATNDFTLRAAGAADLCALPVPVRQKPASVASGAAH